MRHLVLILVFVPALALGQIRFIGTATGTGVTATTCTPGNAASSAVAYDVAIVALHSRTNTAHTCTTNCSSVGLGSSNWAVLGTQGGATTGGRLSIWWLRLAGNLATAPTFGGPATESYVCQMFLFRGVSHEATPYLSASQAANASGASYTMTSGTGTTSLGWMQVSCAGSQAAVTYSTPGGSYHDAIAGQTANANGTDNAIFCGYDSTSDPTGVVTLSSSSISLSPSAAGRSQVFAWKPVPMAGGMNGFFP